MQERGGTDGVDPVSRGRQAGRGEASIRRVGGHPRYDVVLRPTNNFPSEKYFIPGTV